MCMSCPGGGGKSSPRSSTTKAYTPPKTNYNHRPSGNTSSGSSRSSTFGSPKIKIGRVR